MANDFRATQVQVNKIIPSGSTGTGAKLLIYPIESQDFSSPNHGVINPLAFSSQSIGTDIFVYVSGAIGSKDVGDSHGVFVVGGDMVVSGNLTVIGTGGGGGGGGTGTGDASASYVVMSTTASLPNERALAAGNLINITDGGPGNAVTIASTLPSNLMDRLPDISASYIVAGVTSSLPNERRLAAGPGLITTDSGAGGIFQISAPFVSSTFVTLAATSTLPNERVLTAGEGVSIVDAGAGSTITINAVHPSISASYVTLALNANLPNERVLVAGDGISITDGGANGNVTVSVSSASIFSEQFADISASFITIGNTASLPNERRLIAGPGILSIDTGAGGFFSFSAPFVSSTFITLAATSTMPNERVLTAGDGITITDGGAGGAVTVSVTSASIFETFFADISASFITVGTTASLPNERRLVAGPGLQTLDTGAGGVFQVFAPFVSSTFVTLALTSTMPNERALTAGDGITITDGGAGSTVTISVTSASIFETLFADISASFITVGLTSSLPNERRLVGSDGVHLSDVGAGGNLRISTPFVSSTFITLSSTGTLPNERVLTAGDGIAFVDGGAGGQLIISSTLGIGQFADVSSSFILLAADPNLPRGIPGKQLYADASASYVVIGLTSSLPNERRLNAGLGIAIVDGGVGSTVTISSSFNVSSAFVMVGGLGDYPGQRALSAGTGISITDGGAGSTVTISVTSASTTPADVSASYLVVGLTSSLPHERALSAGMGIFFTDSGSNANFNIAVSATNIGPGAQVYSASNNVLLFKTLEEGSNITFVETTSSIRIISAISGGVSGTNVGAGYPIFSGSTGTNPQIFSFKTLVAGTNVAITEGVDTLTINASGGGGGGSGGTFNGFVEALDGINSTTSSLNVGAVYLNSGTLSTSSSCYTGTVSGSDHVIVNLYREEDAFVAATWIMSGQLSNTYLSAAVNIPDAAWYSIRFRTSQSLDTAIIKGIKLVS